LIREVGTEVGNFIDQLERVVTPQLDAICPAKTRRVRYSRHRPSPLSAEAKLSVGVWNVAGYAWVSTENFNLIHSRS